VLAQVGVRDGDEIAAFATALFTLPDLRDVVVTADALHCQHAHAHWVRSPGLRPRASASETAVTAASSPA
jgi:hypothetical protein